jgi:acyl carrier protein
MNRSEIFSRVKSVLTEAFEVADDKIVPEAQLYTDLDLDSLDAIDLAIKLKSETGLVLSEEDIRSLRTIGDIVNLVERKVGLEESASAAEI